MAAADQVNDLSARNHELLDRVDYRLVETEAEKEAIYSLRYRAYLHEGAIEPKAERRLKDRFDDLPNSWTFGIYMDGELASSLRISVGSPDNPETPAVDAFGDILRPQIEAGKTIVDPNRFVADPANRTRFPELPYLTVRLGYVACAYFNADIGTATVRAEHRAFYRRVFLQTPLCEPRPYPTLVKPLCLMAADFNVVREKIFERYPYFRSTQFERRALFERKSEPLAPDLHAPEFQLLQATLGQQA
ncbi:N-acyl amino acid synthase FeeM domain-containing protein [Tardiphaga alba]